VWPVCDQEARGAEVTSVPGRVLVCLLVLGGITFLSCSHHKRALEEVPRNKLDQDAPNPFSPPTNGISYSTSDTCHVTLVLFNVAGQVVDTLVYETQPPGDHLYLLDSNTHVTALPGGVYFYKLEACGQTATKKLVLLK
jgi:hypothetical protein